MTEKVIRRTVFESVLGRFAEAVGSRCAQTTAGSAAVTLTEISY
jgi:hypothetical protein